MTLEQRIRQRFRAALVKYRLTEDGDKILVGLSGGKDSLCLLELMAAQARIHRPAITVEALHVRMENISYETDTRWLEDFCRQHGVRLHVRTTRFDAPTTGQSTKPVCFLCSWMRRKQLFEVAQELGFNKIALGHHQDDIIHTAMMNTFFQGHFATMPARLQMRKMPLTIIRPLCLEREADLEVFARERHYQPQLKRCPNERDTHRTTMRHVFEKLEALNPEVRYSVWNALERDGRLVEDEQAP
jgi:tRNA(Ile)-lysidine synthase TilS/MesJ